MYRVELKERVWMRGSLTCRMFLMYRVELKENRWWEEGPWL